MTYKEAIGQLRANIYGDVIDDFDLEAFELAINVLEKQIPKKPINNRYPWAICPNCGGSVNLKNIQEHIHNKETSHCEHCGQALDCSDTE